MLAAPLRPLHHYRRQPGFLNNGDRQIVLETANPSDDDSIFLAVVTVSGEASLGGILTDLGRVGHTTERDLTLPLDDQDWFWVKADGAGDLVARATFAAGGLASAQMYED